MEHDRGFHFAGMPEAPEFRFPCLFDALRGEGPVGRKDEFCFRSKTFQFAQRRANRDIISAMPVEEKNFLSAEIDDGTAQFDDQLDIRHLLHAESAWKEEMMRGMAGPERGEAENFFAPFFFDAPRDSSDNVAVRRERQMMPVLLERAERKQDNFV